MVRRAMVASYKGCLIPRKMAKSYKILIGRILIIVNIRSLLVFLYIAMFFCKCHIECACVQKVHAHACAADV